MQQADSRQNLLGVLVPLLGQGNLVVFLVHPVIAFALFGFLTHQMRRHLVHDFIKLDIVVRLAGNNQRRARFVNQNRVHLINHGKVQIALHFAVHVFHHVVAQIIEAEFVVRAVGDIGGISHLAFGGHLVAQNHAHGQIQKLIQRAHDVGIALRQIIVHGNDVHALARQCVQIHGQRGHQRFAFARAHFGDFTVVQHHAANQLHVEMAHAQHAARCFAAHGECFGQYAFQCGTVGNFFFEFFGFFTQCFVGQGFHALFHAVDFGHDFSILFEQAVVAAAEDFFCKSGEHNFPCALSSWQNGRDFNITA